jgi:hypothetical protein
MKADPCTVVAVGAVNALPAPMDTWVDALADCMEALMRETGIGVELLERSAPHLAQPVRVLLLPAPTEYTT